MALVCLKVWGLIALLCRVDVSFAARRQYLSIKNRIPERCNYLDETNRSPTDTKPLVLNYRREKIPRQTQDAWLLACVGSGTGAGARQDVSLAVSGVSRAVPV